MLRNANISASWVRTTLPGFQRVSNYAYIYSSTHKYKSDECNSYKSFRSQLLHKIKYGQLFRNTNNYKIVFLGTISLLLSEFIIRAKPSSMSHKFHGGHNNRWDFNSAGNEDDHMYYKLSKQTQFLVPL